MHFLLLRLQLLLLLLNTCSYIILRLYYIEDGGGFADIGLDGHSKSFDGASLNIRLFFLIPISKNIMWIIDDGCDKGFRIIF